MATFGGADPSSVSTGGRYHGREGPTGTALFVRDWRNVFRERQRDIAAFARTYAATGFRWILLYQASGDGIVTAHAGARATDLGRELARHDVAVWSTWGLPDPLTWRSTLPRFLAEARRARARGIAFNAERAWLGERSEADAFATSLRDAELPFMLASYGTPQGFPTFPWESFAEAGALGLAELYDRDVDAAAGYYRRGLEGWREHGFSVVNVAGSTWEHDDAARKSLPELAAHLVRISSETLTPARALWSPTALDANRVEMIRAWISGDLAAVEEIGGRRELVRPRARGGSAGAALAALAAIGIAGAAAARRR